MRAALAGMLLVPMLLAAAPASPPATSGEESQQYQDYVGTVTSGLGAMLQSALSLQGCRAAQGACIQRLGDVKATVDGFRDDLDAHPAPECLRSADTKLRSGLDFYDRGLTTLQQAGEAKDRGKLAQGGVLVAVGTARLAMAVHQGREASC